MKNIFLMGIIVVVFFVCTLIGVLPKENNNPIPNDLYIKMNEINDNKSLIGLSREEVIELLGEPRYQYNDREHKENYTYSAGSTVKKSFFGNTYGEKTYKLTINFDANGKVDNTYIKLDT